MQKIRQILRFHSQGRGKSISKLTGLSRNTVKKYLHRYQRLSLSIESILELSDFELSVLFEISSPVPQTDKRLQELNAVLPAYCKRLQHKGVTRISGM